MKVSARLVAALLVSAAQFGSAVACSGPDPVPFREEVARARSVAVVSVEALRSVMNVEGEYSFPFLVADVRVVEALQGEPALIKRIKYQSAWCGGHSLDVGRFYVVLLHKNVSELKLGYQANSVLGLGDEYIEEHGSLESPSRLLMELRNYARIGSIPEGFDVHPFLELVQSHMEYPSTKRRP